MPVSLLRAVTALLLVSFTTLSVPAQQTKPSPEEKPRKIKRELKKAYVEWINDVDPILTQAERDAWKKLETDEERDQFIEAVWRSRDPDPDTEENEFKEEFYERIAYANEHFSSGKPGRLTDRGRIYIKFGKPDEIESHPAGGLYERSADEGGGVPAVAVTAYARLDDRAKSLAAGFDAHLAKPIDPARFVDTLVSIANL